MITNAGTCWYWHLNFYWNSLQKELESFTKGISDG